MSWTTKLLHAGQRVRRYFLPCASQTIAASLLKHDPSQQATLANRLWFHKNLDNQVARQHLLSEGRNTYNVSAALNRLTRRNARLGRPVSISATNVEAGMTYIDVLAVEHAIVVNKIRRLIGGNAVSPARKAAILKAIRKKARVPDDAYSPLLRSLRKSVRSEGKIASVFQHTIMCLLAYSIPAMVLALILFLGYAGDNEERSFVLNVFMKAGLIIPPLVALAHFWVSTEALAFKDNAYARSVSATWAEVFALKRPDDAALLEMIETAISDNDVLYKPKHIQQLAGFTPREMMTVLMDGGMNALQQYCELDDNNFYSELVTVPIPTDMLPIVEVAEIKKVEQVPHT